MTETIYTLAIVGLGPRGHYALECFVHTLAEQGTYHDVSILLFEEFGQLGNGPVWDTSQTDNNWSNVNERVLIIPERPDIRLGSMSIDRFPSFHDWADVQSVDGRTDRIDIYPPRNVVGRYLVERFETLVSPLTKSGHVKLISERVDDLTASRRGISISTKTGASYDVEQVLLAVGHQPTQLDPQMKNWMTSIKSDAKQDLFAEPYPVENITKMLCEIPDRNVAMRGFGLATIDVIRATSEAIGTFTIVDEETRRQIFSLNEGNNLTIFPFSLDGLPMGPKPLNGRLDAQFKPTQKALDHLAETLSDPVLQGRAQDETFLLDAIVPIISQVFRSLPFKRDNAPADDEGMSRLIVSWINDPQQDHPSILSTDRLPVELLNELVGMATGAVPVCLDYCIGQVWRHCHSTIYASLSHGTLSNEVLAKCIFLDESQKRYSFGPPAESLQQLIALIEAGVLNLDYLNNPEIQATENGWGLSNGVDQVEATVMIDAVLDSPKIKDVSSKLIRNSLDEGILAPVHDEFGVKTAPDGFIPLNNGNTLPVAVLGRLAKGTVIGVDAILECFGNRPREWASSAVDRVVSNGQGRN